MRGNSMNTQLRIYTIKSGLMSEWLILFKEKVVPLHEQYKINVIGAWVDNEHSQFCWVRQFNGEGTIEEQEEHYRNSPDRAAIIGDEPKRFIENMELRIVDQIYPSTT